MPRFQVSRSITIAAPPDRVYETVVDFQTWQTWSPWLCSEPDAVVTITPNSSSVGSVYSWTGEIVGQGEVEHLRLEAPRLIEDEIRFVKPFRSRASVSFEIQPVPSGSELTWKMQGSLPWFLFFLTGQMSALIAMDYDRGLKMLKDWLETGRIETETKIRGVVTVGPLKMAGVRQSCTLAEISSVMQKAFDTASTAFTRNGLPIERETMSVYHRFHLPSQTFEFTSGFAVSETVDGIPDELSVWSIPQMKALSVEHLGSYRHLGNAWSAGNQFVRYKKLKESRVGSFEIYRNDPEDTAEAELKTDVYLPLK